MKNGILILALGAAAVGFANVRSQQKCRERRRALEQRFGTTDPNEIMRRVREEGGSVGGLPGCGGFVLHKEGL